MKKQFKYLTLAFMFMVGFMAFRTNVYADINCAALGDVVIDDSIANVISTIIKALQIAVPIILVIMGSIDLVKGVMAQKEDEIAKGRQTCIKRFIAAILVFFVIAAVKLVISAVASDDNIMNCANCFINGADACSTTNGGGTNIEG